MQRIFQAIGALAVLYFGFLLANYFYSGIFPNNFEGFNQYAGGVGGLAFAVLSLFVGGSEEATKEVGKSISNIGNGWFRIGDVTVNENPQNVLKSKSNSKNSKK